MLAKANYLIHTDAIKNNIIPNLTNKQKNFVYAEETDVLNVALFGMTAKEWRDNNPILAKNGNIRDYTDILHLLILNNLENINAQLIKSKISQKDRLTILNETAKEQIKIFNVNYDSKMIEFRE